MEENQISDNFSSDNDCCESLQAVINGYLENPELATFLYENLSYIRIEDLADAVLFAATGNEIELLRLLAHRRQS